MKKASINLIKAWRELQTDKPPYILNGDEIIISKGNCRTYSNFSRYINSIEFGNEITKSFHTGLLPSPYTGDINQATIYILALNPGFRPLDYYAETYDSNYRKEVISQLKQKSLNREYPWPWINPLFSWTGGGEYWTRKLREIIDGIALRKHQSYVDTIKNLSKKIATLEFVPYHSKSFGLDAKQLKSTELIRNFVKEYVVPKAKRGKAIIIVLRHGEMWDLPKHKNIIIYNSSETRAAHLSLKSKGGTAIIDWMRKY